MREVISVCIAGALGGLTNGVLGGLSGFITRREQHKAPSIDRGALGTIFVGAVAGFIFWAMNTSGIDFDAQRAEPVRIAGAIIAGLGGGRLLKQYVDNAVQHAALQSMSQAAVEFAKVATAPSDSARSNSGEGGPPLTS